MSHGSFPHEILVLDVRILGSHDGNASHSLVYKMHNSTKLFSRFAHKTSGKNSSCDVMSLSAWQAMDILMTTAWIIGVTPEILKSIIWYDPKRGNIHHAPRSTFHHLKVHFKGHSMTNNEKTPLVTLPTKNTSQSISPLPPPGYNLGQEGDLS